MIYKYFAIFEEEGEGYNVTFPDIFGGVTCGDSFEDAVKMAEDLLKTMLIYANGQCFKPSVKEKLEKLFPNKKLVEITAEI